MQLMEPCFISWQVTANSYTYNGNIKENIYLSFIIHLRSIKKTLWHFKNLTELGFTSPQLHKLRKKPFRSQKLYSKEL